MAVFGEHRQDTGGPASGTVGASAGSRCSESAAAAERPALPAAAASRIVVAMSGGVDSTVVAALLKEAGHEVIGVTLQLQPCSDARGSRSCCGVDGVVRARQAAARLGIRHYVLDCAAEFEARVLRPAWDVCASGRTPSPCLPCNERIKFGILLEWARRLGAAFLATGHYARLEIPAAGEPILRRGLDQGKDQSYFLAGLTAGQLRQACFPLGTMTKAQVRNVARSFGLDNAEAPDSQDACLVAEGQSFPELLRERFDAAAVPGPIIDPDGQVLGQHAGIHRYTIGQRHGLGLTLHRPCWVRAVDPATATVFVTHDVRDLDARRFAVGGLAWRPPLAPGTEASCLVQVRYRHPAVPARVAITGPETAVVDCEVPVRAVTPGQAAVFYDGDVVIGRGWIEAAPTC